MNALCLGWEVTRKQDEGAKRAGLARHPLLDTHRSVARLYEELFRRDLLYLHLWTRQVLKGHPGCMYERERQATQLEFELCSSDSAMD